MIMYYSKGHNSTGNQPEGPVAINIVQLHTINQCLQASQKKSVELRIPSNGDHSAETVSAGRSLRKQLLIWWTDGKAYISIPCLCARTTDKWIGNYHRYLSLETSVLQIDMNCILQRSTCNSGGRAIPWTRTMSPFTEHFIGNIWK